MGGDVRLQPSERDVLWRARLAAQPPTPGRVGFQGAVVTDWGTANDRVRGIEAGLDLEMPASDGVNDRRIVAAVEAGELAETTLNRAVERVVAKRMGREMDAATRRMVEARANDMPLRQLVLFSGGGVSFRQIQAFVAVLNWSYVKALKLLGTRASRPA